VIKRSVIKRSVIKRWRSANGPPRGAARVRDLLALREPPGAAKQATRPGVTDVTHPRRWWAKPRAQPSDVDATEIRPGQRLSRKPEPSRSGSFDGE
jgi:hypothetical protein